VLLKPAPDGSGVIAGGGMRPVLEAAGVRDVIGKSLGSKNRLNVVKATIASLQKLRSAESIAAARA
jgi:small subunit ribosomal protein S5